MSSLLPCPDLTDAHYPPLGAGAPYPQNGVPSPRIRAYSLPMVQNKRYSPMYTLQKQLWQLQECFLGSYNVYKIEVKLEGRLTWEFFVSTD
jgi:hypothetical protein